MDPSILWKCLKYVVWMIKSETNHALDRIKNIQGKQKNLRRAKNLKYSLSYEKVYITPDLARNRK